MRLGSSRFGGLRTPSESRLLRRDDIDWEKNRISILEPKVEHHAGRAPRRSSTTQVEHHAGRRIRNYSISPILRPIVDEAIEIFGDKSEFVVAVSQCRSDVPRRCQRGYG